MSLVSLEVFVIGIGDAISLSDRQVGLVEKR